MESSCPPHCAAQWDNAGASTWSQSGLRAATRANTVRLPAQCPLLPLYNSTSGSSTTSSSSSVRSEGTTRDDGGSSHHRLRSSEPSSPRKVRMSPTSAAAAVTASGGGSVIGESVVKKERISLPRFREFEASLMSDPHPGPGLENKGLGHLADVNVKKEYSSSNSNISNSSNPAPPVLRGPSHGGGGGGGVSRFSDLLLQQPPSRPL